MKVCCSLLFLFMLTRPTLSFLSSPPLLHNKQVPSFQKFIKQDCPPSPNAFPFTNPKPPIDSSSALAFATSPEPIHSLFSVGTFCPQPFWLLLILLPKSDITKKIMGGLEIPLLFSLVHFAIVVSSVATEGSGATAQLSEFNNVFDPSGDPQNAFMKMVTFPNFVAEEWIHVLTWDLFIGRYIWLDGLKRGIFTSHSVLLSNLIGPPGLLLHFVTCLLVGKEPWENDANAIEEEL